MSIWAPHVQRDDRSFAHKNGEFFQRKIADDLSRPGKDLTVVEQVPPTTCRQRNSAGKFVLMDRSDQKIVSKKIFKLSCCKRAHQRLASIVAKCHMRIHVWNQLGV